MTNKHEDLRKVCTEALANYFHHSLFDIAPLNMMDFSHKQAESLMVIVDSAIANTAAYVKEKGLPK